METKTCNRCGVEKSVLDYHRSARNRGGHYHTCKDCKRVIDRQYYGEEKREANRKTKMELRRRILQYKAERGCRYCNECEPVALDFHHTDDNKEFSIGAGGASRSWQSLLTEMGKCDVVCANCHRKLHAGLIG